MDIEKYKKLAKIIVVLIIILLVVVFLVLPKIEENEAKKDEKNTEGISTDTPFNASDYDNGKLIQDYLNPSDNDISAAIERFGVGNYYFNDQGLYVYALNDDEENRLYTDVWPKTKFTDMVVEPEMDIYLIEHGDTYLLINLENVTEKDLKKYIKSIEDEYSNELYSRRTETIYRASNKDEMIVDIKFYPEKSMALIRYDI